MVAHADNLTKFNIEEFKKQLPSKAKILIEDQIEEDRGIRFTLIGQLWKE